MLAKNLKIFLGPAEAAKNNARLAKALREKGIRVTLVSRDLTPYQDGVTYAHVLKVQSRNRFIRALRYLYSSLYSIRFIWSHDVFIFQGGNSLFVYNLDLPILKLMGKKVLMRFVGSDIRHHEAFVAAAKKAGLKYYVERKDTRAGPKGLKRKLRMIRVVEKYADYIISSPVQSQLLTRKYYRLPLAIDFLNMAYRNKTNPKPIVVHAPSNPQLKGTPHVLEAVDRLKNEGYDFELCLFTNKSNVEVLETLSKADIAIDQLYGECAGAFALEAMASGCAVLGGNLPEFSGFPRELPTIHTNPDNIYDNLKMLLDNPVLKCELGEKGREYIEKYHDPQKVADQWLKLIDDDVEGLQVFQNTESPTL